jgi:histidinol-phosphate/aromatic aminotransferase/cobyric acid decarboxylase-like protein/choline kinase
MQAIILAAGMGRRLGSYTKENTKCMVQVNGVALIDRVLNQLSQLHLRRVLIVVGYKGEELKNYIGKRYDDRLKIEFADNAVYDKTNNIYSLSLVKRQLAEDDTLLIESDLIFEDSLFPLIVNDPNPNVALVAKYETWMDGTMVQIDDECNIVNFVPKKAFNYAEVGSYYKTVNIYKFSREFSSRHYVPFLDAYCCSQGNNEYYEQVLRVITLLDRVDMKALPIGDRKWYEIDDVQDLDIAETIFSSEEQRLPKYMKRYGGYWRFPNMLDFCYLVNPYFPTRRMKEEMRANFDILLTEYPSGMFVNSLLAGKYFSIRKEYSAVGNGAAELIKALMEEGEGKMGVVYPTFEEYPNRSVQSLMVPFVPQNADFSYSATDLKAFFGDKGLKRMLLINPDNPSGNFLPKADVLDLASWAADRGITLVVDESFVDFSEGYPDNSLLCDAILEAHPNLVVVKSISKSYGVPGLRLGVMASSDTEMIGRVKREVSIWNINSFAEFYMQIFNKYSLFYDQACAKFGVERRRFGRLLAEVPFLRVIPSQANFFLCEVTGKYGASELTQLLLTQHNVLIKDCNKKHALEGKNYVRIAVRDEKDNNRLIEILKTL